MVRKAPRVAVIGARGIGRWHAKWFAAEGADVVAFSGRDPGKLATTATTLHSIFPFAGHAYDDTAEMLERERPDIVVVATPPESHLGHLRSALDAGAHVYVEKPIAWDEERPATEWLAAAREIVRLAESRGLFIGVNAQYVCAWDGYVDLVGRAAVRAARSFLVDFETSTLAPERRNERIWIDVGSHPLSLLRCAMPRGRMRDASVEFRASETEAVARFECADPDGRVLDATLRCARVQGAPRRRFGVDDLIAEHRVAPGPDGVVRAVLSRGRTERVSIDPMHDSIRRFLGAIARRSAETIACSGRDGVRDLELQVRLAALARPGRS